MGTVGRNDYLARWREKNRESLREYQRNYMRARRAENPEKDREINRLYARRMKAEKPELVLRRLRDWYHAQTLEKKRQRAEKNRKSSREAIRKAAKKWAKQNPGKKNAETAKRRALLKFAMPPWVDRGNVRKIYIECARLSKETGIIHEVDHIFPLQHDLYCGLHVPWNLQIITAEENRKKSNKVL